MPDFRRANCKNCGRRRDDGYPLSWTGLCNECGTVRNVQNSHDLHYHRGEGFHRWRAAMAASVGAVLVDEPQAKG